MRTRGYAVRLVRSWSTSWVEVYSGDQQNYDATAWTPVYPRAPEESGDPSAAAGLSDGYTCVVTAGDGIGKEDVTWRYCHSGRFKLAFTRGGLVQKGFEHYLISIWHNGAYVRLYPDAYIDQSGELPAPGDYRLEATIHSTWDVTNIKLLPFHLEPGEDKLLTLALDSSTDLPLGALVERKLPPPTESSGLNSRGSYLIAVFDSGVQSLRIKALLKPYAALDSVQYIELGYAPDDTNLKPMLDYLQVKPDDAKPVVVVIVDGKTLLYRRGYDLSVGDWVQRALGGGK
jgi:hypothetical protein